MTSDSEHMLHASIKKWDAAADGALSVSIVGEGWSLSHRSDRHCAAASLIKLAILAAALRMHEKGELDMDERLTITADNRVGGAGVLAFIDSESMTVRSLIDLMISISDNTASNLLLNRIGIARINAVAAQLGMTHTDLQRQFWDAKAQAAGLENWMSTGDIVRLLTLIATPSGAFNAHSRDIMLGALAKQQFKGKLLDRARRYPGLQTFSKTGEMPDVEGDACIVRYKGETIYIAVVMNGKAVVEHGLDALRDIGDAFLKHLNA